MMKAHGYILRLFAAMNLLLLAVGCGGASYEGESRSEVSGSVSYNGAPVQQGTINLTPIGHAGRSASASIEAGKYLIAEDQGPNLGKYRVEIFVFEPPKNAPAEDADVGMVQVAPKEFNEESTVELEVDGRKVQKDFTL